MIAIIIIAVIIIIVIAVAAIYLWPRSTEAPLNAPLEAVTKEELANRIKNHVPPKAWVVIQGVDFSAGRAGDGTFLDPHNLDAMKAAAVKGSMPLFSAHGKMLHHFRDAKEWIKPYNGPAWYMRSDAYSFLRRMLPSAFAGLPVHL